MHILLHTCCAPCSTATVEQLNALDQHTLSLYFYNPNIGPEQEYQRRRDELLSYVGQHHPSIVVTEGAYDYDRWFSLIAPLQHTGEKGMRCYLCYYLRLNQTFLQAQQMGCDAVSTTLAISPHKHFPWLEQIGRVLEQYYGIAYILEKWDYKRSLALSRQVGLYRQDYCGCIFSLQERDTRKIRTP